MIIRQLFDEETRTCTYLLGDEWSHEAVLVDPVRENVDRDLQLVSELGLRLVFSLDTHVHADHVTAAGLLRARSGAQVVLARAGGAEGADRLVEDGDAVRFGLQALEVRATPGHTNGCVTYVTADRGRAFTGDALLIRGCGRTDFQQGDARTLYRSIRDKVFSLPDDALVLPGHDYKGRTASTVREERLYNPRLGGGRTEDEFVAIMDALHLAYPKKMDVAVPANLRCGRIGDEAWDAEPHTDPDAWSVRRTPTGAPNVDPGWFALHRHEVQLVDVREPEERQGADGAIEGDRQVGMDRVLDEARRWDREAPLVVYCRSGGRSDRIAIELERAGFARVASLAGGILRWNGLGLPVTGGRQG